MMRGNRMVLVLTIVLAAAGGALLAWLVPPLGMAAGNGLDLVPAPPADEVVQVPSFADLAERAIPAVVSITSRKVVERKDPHEGLMDNPFFRRFFQDRPLPQAPDQGPGRKDEERWGGSGFFITHDGYILTNRHVIEGAEHVVVTTSDDDEYEARIVGTDPYLDLALLKVDADREFPALPLGDSDDLRVGEWVIAIGNPIMYRNTVTVGVVSGKGRRLGFDPADLGTYIQTDAAINFGNSGGPLLNARGEVVGINTAIIRDDPGHPFRGYVEGIGFALPITQAKRVLDQLAKEGTVHRGWLGVTVAPVTREKAEYYGLDKPRGAFVNDVSEDSPAAEAGLREEGSILAVDGTPIRDSGALVEAISSRLPGDEVTLTVWRDRKKIEVRVKLGERKVGLDEEGPAAGPRKEAEDEGTAEALGIRVVPAPGAWKKLLEKKGLEGGVLVDDVDPASPAWNKGVRPGLLIVDVNGKPTPTVAAFREAAGKIRPGQIVRLRAVLRDGEELFIFFRAPRQ